MTAVKPASCDVAAYSGAFGSAGDADVVAIALLVVTAVGIGAADTENFIVGRTAALAAL